MTPWREQDSGSVRPIFQVSDPPGAGKEARAPAAPPDPAGIGRIGRHAGRLKRGSVSIPYTSLKYVSQLLCRLGIERSHVAIHNRGVQRRVTARFDGLRESPRGRGDNDSLRRPAGCTAPSIPTRTGSSLRASFPPRIASQHAGFSTNPTSSTGSGTSRFSSTVPITSSRFSTKTATTRARSTRQSQRDRTCLL